MASANAAAASCLARLVVALPRVASAAVTAFLAFNFAVVSDSTVPATNAVTAPAVIRPISSSVALAVDCDVVGANPATYFTAALASFFA